LAAPVGSNFSESLAKLSDARGSATLPFLAAKWFLLSFFTSAGKGVFIALACTVSPYMLVLNSFDKYSVLICIGLFFFLYDPAPFFFEEGEPFPLVDLFSSSSSS
jgi:hypothetical protein